MSLSADLVSGQAVKPEIPANQIVISFDIDGTMEFGAPPGPVSSALVRELVELGYVIGSASDRAQSTQAPLWQSHGVEPSFVGGKHHLIAVKAGFVAERYIHVGDTQIDRHYAELAGFEFILIDDLTLPIIAESIHSR